jgi:hypothetical protein
LLTSYRIPFYVSGPGYFTTTLFGFATSQKQPPVRRFPFPISVSSNTTFRF